MRSSLALVLVFLLVLIPTASAFDLLLVYFLVNF